MRGGKGQFCAGRKASTNSTDDGDGDVSDSDDSDGDDSDGDRG